MGSGSSPGTRLPWKMYVPDLETGVIAVGDLDLRGFVDHLRLCGAVVQWAICDTGLWGPWKETCEVA